MKKSIIIIIVIFSSFFFSNCSKKSKDILLNKREERIITNCISFISNVNIIDQKESYLVNPYFNNFEFNNFIASHYEIDEHTFENKSKILQKLGLNESKFIKIKESTNKKYYNKYCKDLIKYSKGDESKTVLTFSGISKNLFFLEIINYTNEINKNDLYNKNLANKIIKDIDSYVIILKGSEVKEISLDGGIVREIFQHHKLGREGNGSN